jgi:hypothetical protein
MHDAAARSVTLFAAHYGDVRARQSDEVIATQLRETGASSRSTSRAARRSTVRPPPSAYRITPAYRRDHPPSPSEARKGQ